MKTKTLGMISLCILGGLVILLGGFSTAQPGGSAPEGIPITEGLIAYWPLDEGSGETAQDASGNGHDGEVRNGAEWAEGVLGGALRFDGVDDYVLIPYDPALDVEKGLTIALWAYLESEPDVGEGNDWRLLVGRNGFSPYGLLIEQDGRLNGSVYIESDRQVILSEDPLPPGEWVHIAFTYDAEVGQARLYLQGQIIGEIEAATGTFKVREGRPLTLSLPTREDSPEVHTWPGTLDEIYLFERALAPEEVQVLFEQAQTSDASGT